MDERNTGGNMDKREAVKDVGVAVGMVILFVSLYIMLGCF